MSRRITSPLQQLTSAVHEMAGGNRKVYVPEKGSLETRELSKAFNKMAGILADHEKMLVDEIGKATRNLSEKVKTLEASGRISQAVLDRGLSRENLIKIILRSTMELTNAEISSFALEEDGDCLHLYILRKAKNELQYYKVPRQKIFNRVMLERGPVILNNIDSQDCFIQEEIYAGGKISSALIIPLIIRRRLIGIINFCSSKNNFFSKEHIADIEQVINLSAVALDNNLAYKSLEEAFFQTIKSLASALDFRDPYTGGHSEQVMKLAEVIARANKLSEEEIKVIMYAGALHDVGKIGIKENILNKPGRLEKNEILEMQRHPVIGSNILQPVSMLREVSRLVYYHHERFDGKGYPEGLSGKNIPLGSRIIAIADSVDAMNSDRSYRKRLKPEVIREELVKNAGTQFDPELIKVFLPYFNKYFFESKNGSNKYQEEAGAN